jgi:hypothetical protein
MYKIIKIEDYKGHWGIKLPQYQVVEEYYTSNIFTKMGIIKPRLKQRKVKLPTVTAIKVVILVMDMSILIGGNVKVMVLMVMKIVKGLLKF